MVIITIIFSRYSYILIEDKISNFIKIWLLKLTRLKPISAG